MTWPGAWPTHEVHTSRERLVELRDTVSSSDLDENPLVESALTRFLVVRACGHVEITFDESFCALAVSKSSPDIAGFVRSQFFHGANPTAKRISETLGKLDRSRASRFDAMADEDDGRMKRQLALLVDRRNRIAHGQSENVTRRVSLDLADLALRLGDWLTAELDPR